VTTTRQMSDIVERLRRLVGDLPPIKHPVLATEAADEIERLRSDTDMLRKSVAEKNKEILRLRAAAKEIKCEP